METNRKTAESEQLSLLDQLDNLHSLDELFTRSQAYEHNTGNG
jgi:hypothetical protein